MIKSVRAGRRAGSSRLFKSAYRKSQRIPAVLALLAMLWYSAVPAGAATNTWSNGGGDALWDNIANWSLGAAPLAVDDAIFPTPVPLNGGTVTHTKEGGKSILTLSDDFVDPKTPDPHWQLVDSKGRVYLVLPFDPEEAWGPKSGYHVRGTINGTAVRGALEKFGSGYFLPPGPA